MRTRELANLDGQANLLIFSQSIVWMPRSACKYDTGSMVQISGISYIQLLKYITRLACPRTTDGQTVTH